MERIVFIGPGRVALALGTALHEADEGIFLVYMGRSPDPPDHPLFHEGGAGYRYGLEPIEPGTSAVLLTVPDDALPSIAAGLAEQGDPPPGCVALHCSGALGADPLEPLHARGYGVGTLHPLQAVASPLGEPGRFRETYFAVSGDSEALAVGRRLVALLGGRAFAVPTSRRPLYHAAAVMASNYLVVLLDRAARLLREAGADAEEAEGAITALARGTLENVGELGVDHALTGPLVRGDVETVALHLRTLDAADAELYAAFGLLALETFGDRLPPDGVRRMAELFERHT